MNVLTPGRLAQTLEARLRQERRTTLEKLEAAPHRKGSYEIAYNQSTVAARLWFDELVRVVLPMSDWWQTRICKISDDPGNHVFLNCKLRPSKAKLLSGWQVHRQSDAGRAGRAVGHSGDRHHCAGERGTGRRAGNTVAAAEQAQLKERHKYFQRVVNALAGLVQGMSLGDTAPWSIW